MQCPFCGDEGNRVIDTRLARDGSEIRRRRECEECGRRFTTRERVEATLPKIIKRDERREEYRRDKLLGSIERACVKRPLSVEAVEALADRVERALQEMGEREVSSRILGSSILDELASLDEMAAVRFASVFLNFQGPEDYVEYFASLGRAAEGGAVTEDAPRGEADVSVSRS